MGNRWKSTGAYVSACRLGLGLGLAQEGQAQEVAKWYLNSAAGWHV